MYALPNSLGMPEAEYQRCIEEERALREAEERAELVHPPETFLDTYEKVDLDWDRMASEPDPYEREFDDPGYWPYSGVGC